MSTFEGHKDYVYAIDFLPNGHLVTCSRGGEVIIFDPVTEQMVNSFQAHSSFIYCCCTLLDNNIATGSADNTIKIWNPVNG